MAKGTEWLKEIKNPGKEYRGKPFWSWNGELKENELRQQIKMMKDMGLGGFFMHSRTGLKTEYMGKDWLDAVNVCIDEAKKQDMEPWLYDEDRWPSGFAGGLVTKKVKNRIGYLFFQEVKKPNNFKPNKKTIALYICKKKSNLYTEIVRIKTNSNLKKLPKSTALLHFFYDKNSPSTNFNGYTYVDTMEESAIKDFIKVTHEAYKKSCGKEFGKAVPGIFTDEPYFGAANYEQKNMTDKFGDITGKYWWTPKLPKVFKNKFGYDILDHLPEIFLSTNAPRVVKSRWNYFETLTSMFVKAYLVQIGEWCEKNNLQHTGHMLEEPTLFRQAQRVGSAMRAYEYMQAPGMDSLTEYWREYDTAKQVSSAARQFGKKWRLTETYGCTGWDFSFKGQKATSDWQAVLGINNRCQHLSWYTMEGEAKRDYPAGIFYQSPWWQQYKKVEDYFARLHVAMTQGTETRDFLLIHPIESMWSVYRGVKDDTTNSLDGDFRAATDYLLRNHLDFDYGEEDIINRHAKVITKNKKTTLQIGQASYTTIVVPPMCTIRSSTLKIIQQFNNAGGNVIFFGAAPEYVDCQLSNQARELAIKSNLLPFEVNKTYPAFEKARRVSIQDEKGHEADAVLYLWREDKDNHFLLLVNTSQTIEGDRFKAVRDRNIKYPKLTVRGFGDAKVKPCEVDFETGQLKDVVANKDKQNWLLETSLDEVESKIFIFPKTKKLSEKIQPLVKYKKISKKKIQQSKIPYQLSEQNNLVLNMAVATINGNTIKETLDILEIDHRVHDAAGWKRRAGNMIQPWANQVTNEQSIPVSLEYTFKVNDLPSGAIYLAIENPSHYEIKINDITITNYLDQGWWVDQSLKTILLESGILKLGENKIELSTNYKENFSGLETIHILGNFGVKLVNNEPQICSLPTHLKLGNWVNQSLAFYSGNVSYQFQSKVKITKNQKVFLHVPAYEGVAVQVIVNDKNAGVIAWQPNEIDISAYVKNGNNEITIIILGHRRNSHGPFHGGKTHFDWTGPSQFAFKDAKYQLVSCGLIKPPEIITKTK